MLVVALKIIAVFVFADWWIGAAFSLDSFVQMLLVEIQKPTTLMYRKLILSRAFLRHDVVYTIHINLSLTSAHVSFLYSSWRRQPSVITCLTCAQLTQYCVSQH